MGRTELINSTISNISNHYMIAFLLPQHMLKNIDKKVRDFFWGNPWGLKKIHTINWNELTKPKIHGGLGIRSAIPQNKSRILSQIWRAKKEINTLCSSVLASEYGTHLDKKKSALSYTCRSILKTLPLYKSLNRKILGDGANTSFWFDN